MILAKYAIVIVTYNRVDLLRECIAHAAKQTIPPESIIIVDNASTDDTKTYLQTLNKEEGIDIISLSQNIGGAGGFAVGMERALQKNAVCVLMIDDDAILAENYMEKILAARNKHPQYKAFAGTVETNGEIDTFHRRNLQKVGLLMKNVQEEDYRQDYFTCDIASFCGMVADTDLIRQMGLPHAEYFIFFDDTEYSLRIRQVSRFLVITDAKLEHKKKEKIIQNYPRRYEWKDYYNIRNRILMVKEHGSLVDEAVNFFDLFLHIVFRNWLFGVIKRSHYDWKYERSLTRAAIKDSTEMRCTKVSGGDLDRLVHVTEKVSESVYIK